MLDIRRCVSDARLVYAGTGLDKADFNQMVIVFDGVLARHRKKKKPHRYRCIGAGKKHTLKTAREKLFFILLYTRCHATFEVFAHLFYVDRAQAFRWVKEYLPLLEEVIGREVMLPLRKIHSIETLVHHFPFLADVLVGDRPYPISHER